MWTVRTLGEISDDVGGVIQTGPFGSQLHESDYVEDGIPMVMPKNILDGKIDTRDIAFIKEEDVERLQRHKMSVGDIVYGRRGDIGRRGLISARENGWLCGTGCLRVSLGDCVLNPTYLYYYLGQPSVVSWIANQAVGATMPNLNTGILRSVVIHYPRLPVQHRIASVLSAYDDLIENNTRRIKILEDMAQMLYREWFVNFRFPGHEEVRMVDSELGPIPQGWTAKCVTEAVFVNPSTKVSKEGIKPFLPMGSLSDNSMLIRDVEEREGNSGSKFKNGDTLFARITPCLENGKTGFVQFLPSNDAVAFGSTEFIVLRSKTACSEYVYLMARSSEFRDNAIKSMSGATGRQRVQEACFNRFWIAQPDGETLGRFQSVVGPMFRLIHALSSKNQNLRTTRDFLLPKLISGEIPVEAADEAAAELVAQPA
jgi:type I restriction enzyme, S subunit